MRFAPFCDLTLRRLVGSNRRFEKTCRCHQGWSSQSLGPWRWDQCGCYKV